MVGYVKNAKKFRSGDFQIGCDRAVHAKTYQKQKFYPQFPHNTLNFFQGIIWSTRLMKMSEDLTLEYEDEGVIHVSKTCSK